MNENVINQGKRRNPIGCDFAPVFVDLAHGNNPKGYAPTRHINELQRVQQSYGSGWW